MANPNVQFSIVLMGRFPGKDRSVAQTLAKTFARDDTWGLQVVGATPITILTNLTAVQAQAIYKELVVIEESAGCRFRVQPRVDESYPAVNWPSPPAINGRPVSEFTGSGLHPAQTPAGPAASLSCPHCHKPIQVRLMAPGVGAPARTPSGTPAALLTSIGPSSRMRIAR